MTLREAGYGFMSLSRLVPCEDLDLESKAMGGGAGNILALGGILANIGGRAGWLFEKAAT